MGTMDPAPPLGFSSLLNNRNLYFGSILRSASDAPSYILSKQTIRTIRRFTCLIFFGQSKILFYSYLSSNSIKNGDDAGQTTTESNSNQACQNNTEDSKKDIKCQKDNSQPVGIEKHVFFSIMSTNFAKFIIHHTIYQIKNSKCSFWSSTNILGITFVLHLFESSNWSFNSN